MTQTADFDAQAARNAIEYCYEQGWSDGLPVVPPTEELVREFIEYVGREPQEVLATAHHLGRTCTVWQAAVNAVMAGCLPEYFPVVVAAMEALQDGTRGFNALMASTTGPCPLLVVNGPIRNQVGINCKGNIFGPGFRANATIGRTIRLIILNAFGVRPHDLDQATQSTPAKYSFCIGENEEESPWEPLHVEMGLDKDISAVTTYWARSNMHVENRHTQNPEKVLLSIADAMSYVGAPGIYLRYAPALVMGPEHGQLLAREGWSKADAKRFIWEHYGRPLCDMRRMGRGDFEEQIPGSYIYVDHAYHNRMPGAENFTDDTFINFTQSPDDILLVVGGANNGGVSMVILGLGGKGRTQPIRLLAAKG